jgi:excinuclease UvrABC ATPase subunit
MTLDQDVETVRQAIVDDWVNAGDHSPIIPDGLAALDRIQTRLREAEGERDEARKSVDELQGDLVNVVAADIAERDRYREALDLTRRHFRCPDCDHGVTSTNDRCKTCDGTGLDTDTDFRLATALSEPKETQ